MRRGVPGNARTGTPAASAPCHEMSCFVMRDRHGTVMKCHVPLHASGPIAARPPPARSFLHRVPFRLRSVRARRRPASRSPFRANSRAPARASAGAVRAPDCAYARERHGAGRTSPPLPPGFCGPAPPCPGRKVMKGGPGSRLSHAISCLPHFPPSQALSARRSPGSRPPPVCILHIVPPSVSVPFAPPPACLRRVPVSRVIAWARPPAFCAGAVRAPDNARASSKRRAHILPSVP